MSYIVGTRNRESSIFLAILAILVTPDCLAKLQPGPTGYDWKRIDWDNILNDAPSLH